MSATSAERTVTLHGHAFSYTDSGSGPALLFIHGILGSQKQWAHLVDQLDEDHRLIVPDLFGHGESAKPVGDYSLGAHAATLRDLLDRLGIEQVSLVGHSLGGGIAMVFSYLFPERVDRLGARRERRPRARGQPAAALGHPARARSTCCRSSRRGGCATGSPPPEGCSGSVGVRPGRDLTEVWDGFTSLGDADTRRAFLATTRAVIDPGGQSVNAHDYLPDATPDPDAGRVGHQGPDDPGVARGIRDRLDARTAGSSCSRGRGTSRTSTTPTGSPRWCASSSAPAGLTAGRRRPAAGQEIWSQSSQPLCSTSQAIRP